MATLNTAKATPAQAPPASRQRCLDHRPGIGKDRAENETSRAVETDNAC